MGSEQSHEASCPIENEDKNSRKQYYYDKYNWVPSLPGFEFDNLTMDKLKRKFDCETELTGYIDLRTSFPQIQNLNSLPFNPIISLVYLLHYQLLIQNSLVKSCTQRLLRVGNCKHPTQINSVKSTFLGVLRWGLHVV